jgi:DNA-binding LacI/PurR family transcriptional regulator
LLGLEHAARDRGYFVHLVGPKTLDRGAVADAVGRFRQQSVAGIVLVSPQAALADAFRDLPHDIPTVAIWGQTGAGVPVVASNEAEGARLATQHLLGLGHATVWHLAGPPGRIGAEARIRGWQQALAAAGVAAPDHLVGDWTARSGYEAGCILATERSATAIFVGNDQMALGLLRALHERGCAVPQQVSVIGFDDVPDAAFYTPPLTTIRQHFTELGREAMCLLLRALERGGEAATDNVVLPVELVVRGSTGPPG